jgi:chromosome segregation ATPase
MKERNRFMRTLETAALSLLLTTGWTTVAGAQAGVKQAENLAKKTEASAKAITEARQQIQKTLDVYNALVEGNVEDTKKAYGNLQKEMDRSDDRVEDVRKRVDEMNVEADKYFADWTTNLDGITSPDLRARSEERLQDARKRYAQILATTGKAGDRFASFMQNLRDQVTYLGHDLNPSALASLKGDATKLNTAAESLFSKIDSAIKEATSYATSLRPQS